MWLVLLQTYETRKKLTMKPIIFIAVLALMALPFLSMGQSGGYSQPEYQNGDVNLDGILCFDDPVTIIYALYRTGEPLPCPDVADADRNGVVELNDALLLLGYLFRGTDLFDCPVTCGSEDGGYYPE